MGLKKVFTSEPVLGHPDKNKKLIVQVDASDIAMGAYERALRASYTPLHMFTRSSLRLRGIGWFGTKKLLL